MRFTVGVDEVGRGPLAGVVMAGAVILDPDKPISGLADSKKISAKKRELLAVEIKKKSLAWSVAEASIAEIDEVNILQASLLAMQRAVAELPIEFIANILVDGNKLPKLNFPAEAIVGGDGSIPVISAASIIAKVTRDNYMVELDKLYPEYGFAQNKGYPTKKHREAVKKYGLSECHRKSFTVKL